MRVSLLLVVAACGSQQPARKIVAPPPKPQPVAATCSDAGVILRGNVDAATDDVAKAKEQAIASACSEDAWSQAVIDCVASTPHPQDCIDKLSEPQLTAFQRRLDVWRDEHMPASSDPAAMISCTEVASAAGYFKPRLADPLGDDVWQLTARAHYIAEECEHGWTESFKRCLLDAGSNPDDLEDCRDDAMSADERDAFITALRDIEMLATQIAKAKQKPTTFTCAKVVAHHYADALWKQKVDGYKPSERNRLIADSRTMMAKACAAEQWSDTKRACIVVGGGQPCFDGDKLTWGFPATGTVKAVGITECDEYSAQVLKFVACDKLPQDARDSIVKSQQQMLVEIARLPVAERAKMGTSCAAAKEAIVSSLTNAGC